jgi:hypothetical protein
MINSLFSRFKWVLDIQRRRSAAHDRQRITLHIERDSEGSCVDRGPSTVVNDGAGWVSHGLSEGRFIRLLDGLVIYSVLKPIEPFLPEPSLSADGRCSWNDIDSTVASFGISGTISVNGNGIQVVARYIPLVTRETTTESRERPIPVMLVSEK